MAGGKNNTERIETLENQAANMSARIDVFDTQLKAITELLKKCSDATQGHDTKITIVEQQLLIVDLKDVVAKIGSTREELIAIRKDIETIQNWKAEQKREKDEAARRWWSFGPNIAAAFVSGFIAIFGVLLSVVLTYYINHPK